MTDSEEYQDKKTSSSSMQQNRKSEHITMSHHRGNEQDIHRNILDDDDTDCCKRNCDQQKMHKDETCSCEANSLDSTTVLRKGEISNMDNDKEQLGVLFKVTELASKLASMDSDIYHQQTFVSNNHENKLCNEVYGTTKQEIQSQLDIYSNNWQLEQTQFPTLISSVHRLHSNIGHLQNENSDLLNQVRSMKSLLQEQEFQNQRLRKACRKLYKQNQKLKEKFQKSNQENKVLKNSLEQFKHQCEQEEMDMEELKVACHETLLKNHGHASKHMESVPMSSPSRSYNRVRTSTVDSTFSDFDAYSFLGDLSIAEEHEKETCFHETMALGMAANETTPASTTNQHIHVDVGILKERNSPHTDQSGSIHSNSLSSKDSIKSGENDGNIDRNNGIFTIEFESAKDIRLQFAEVPDDDDCENQRFQNSFDLSETNRERAGSNHSKVLGANRKRIGSDNILDGMKKDSKHFFHMLAKKTGDASMKLEHMINEFNPKASVKCNSNPTKRRTKIVVEDFQFLDCKQHSCPSIGSRLIAINGISLLTNNETNWTVEKVLFFIEEQHGPIKLKFSDVKNPMRVEKLSSDNGVDVKQKHSTVFKSPLSKKIESERGKKKKKTKEKLSLFGITISKETSSMSTTDDVSDHVQHPNVNDSDDFKSTHSSDRPQSENVTLALNKISLF